MPPELNPEGKEWIDTGLGGFLKDLPQYAMYTKKNLGKHRVPTLRNVDLRPHASFVKAFGHNGYFKSLEAIVHFYNTRDILPVADRVKNPLPGCQLLAACGSQRKHQQGRAGRSEADAGRRGRSRCLHENPLGWLQAAVVGWLGSRSPGSGLQLHGSVGPRFWSRRFRGFRVSDLLSGPLTAFVCLNGGCPGQNAWYGSCTIFGIENNAEGGHASLKEAVRPDTMCDHFPSTGRACPVRPDGECSRKGLPA